MNDKPTSNYSIGEKDKRPWGDWQVIETGKSYAVKKIEVKPHEKLSLQYHNHRSEHWIIVSGKAKITLGGDIIKAYPGDHIYIPSQTKHRIHNIAESSLIFIEVQYGKKLDENDIIRIKDKYARV